MGLQQGLGAVTALFAELKLISISVLFEMSGPVKNGPARKEKAGLNIQAGLNSACPIIID